MLSIADARAKTHLMRAAVELSHRGSLTAHSKKLLGSLSSSSIALFLDLSPLPPPA